MYRNAIRKLISWKNKENRKPLLLKGARQVGKTWLMKEFGRQEFKKTAYVSFFNNTRLKRVFDNDFDIERILMNLNIESRTEITPKDTLIILDEIQEAPKALEALKYFCENAPEYPIIAAGSLLGVALHSGISFPVGKVNEFSLYPMSFPEFLSAMGEDGLAQLLWQKDYGFTDDFTDKYLFWLKNYMYVGGMPEVVSFFADHKNYEGVREIQNSIVAQYKDDFGKHISPTELSRINMVWDSIPMQLTKENRKFFFGQIKKGARASDFEQAIQWLSDSGLVHRVYKVNKPAMPLSAYKEFNTYKLFMVDVGLLGAISGLDTSAIIEGNSVFVEFKGALICTSAVTCRNRL